MAAKLINDRAHFGLDGNLAWVYLHSHTISAGNGSKISLLGHGSPTCIFGLKRPLALRLIHQGPIFILKYYIKLNFDGHRWAQCLLGPIILAH